MQSINHSCYINYLILQSNSKINVEYERKGNSWFPEDLRQGMIKKIERERDLLYSYVFSRYKSLFICQ